MQKTIKFYSKPSIIATSSIVGPKEGEGPLGRFFERIIFDDTFGEKTYEKAECKMLSYAIEKSVVNAGLSVENIDALLSGDLLNQIVSSSFAARSFEIPFIGVYNACSTMTEALALGAMMTDGGYFDNVVAATGSHFSTAERQYRYPLELGCVRPPQSQWTVTGAGSAVISSKRSDEFPHITHATFGIVSDFGVKDANNMGAAMATAAAATIKTHLENLNLKSSYYDLIVTGDLGALGSRLLKEVLRERGVDIDKNHVDCGELIYNIDEEEYQGGSGAGCSASVFNSYIYDKMRKKKLNKVLFVATGALLSTLTTQQGESIPSIAHAVGIENEVN